jgi:hypothetical protein
MSLYFTAPVGFLITYCYGFGKKLDSAKSTLVDLDDIKNAENYIFSTGLVRKTPLVPDYVLNNGKTLLYFLIVFSLFYWKKFFWTETEFGQLH